MMTKLRNNKKLLYAGLGVVILVVAALLVASFLKDDPIEEVEEAVQIKQGSIAAYDKDNKVLPADENFEKVAESNVLELWADRTTGHFQVKDKRTGHVTRSYPNPDQFENAGVSNNWLNHLRSPVVMDVIDFKAKSPNPFMTSVAQENARISEWNLIDGGYSVTFSMSQKELEIALEVRLVDDYVETRIIDDKLVEGKFKFVNVKTFPFLGAEQYVGQDGYLLLPDGPGAIYRFKNDVWDDRTPWKEPIYGHDDSYWTISTNRQRVTMPIVGYKSGNTAYLAVAHDGEEYGYVYASHAGVNSNYNWATFEHTYRLSYWQPTSKTDSSKGFYTYTKDRFHEDRVIRYYFLPTDQSDVAGMAAKYRDYLIHEKGMQLRTAESDQLPLYLSLLGGDIEKGTFRNRYVPGTTTEQAKEIVGDLHASGINNLVVNYIGWQSGGYTHWGFGMDVAKQLGGNSGMKSLADYIHELGGKLILNVNYYYNTDGKDFKANLHGMQNLAGSILKFKYYFSNVDYTVISPKYALEKLQDDLKKYKELGADGLLFEGLGSSLSSDYNSRYFSMRPETAEVQAEIAKTARDGLGSTLLDYGNAYLLPYSDSIVMPNDYSYDLFVDEPVAFAPMALHGLVEYSLGFSNKRDEYQTEFLRAVEYGSIPSFELMYEETTKFRNVFSISTYSANYFEWKETLLKEYNRLNEALGDVQDVLMVNNRSIAYNVKETTYANGKRIIVNYNTTPVTVEGNQIPAMDFIVLNGGGQN